MMTRSFAALSCLVAVLALAPAAFGRDPVPCPAGEKKDCPTCNCYVPFPKGPGKQSTGGSPGVCNSGNKAADAKCLAQHNVKSGSPTGNR